MAKSPASSLDRVFRALADPARREILQRLEREGELTVSSVAEPLPIHLPTVSKHVDVLVGAGLVHRRRQGAYDLLEARGEPLREAVEWLQRYDRFWTTNLTRLAEHLETRGRPLMVSYTVTRWMPASPATVFVALSTARGLASWIGPDSGPVLDVEVDLRIGGRFRLRFRTEDGSEFEASGTYLTVDPPHTLAMTWIWVGRDERESVIEITLAELDGGTELRLRQTTDDERSAQQNQGGWARSLDKLAALYRREGNDVSQVRVTMAMSLDGFITGPDDDADNPAGVGGMRLMDWLDGGRDQGSGGGAKWRPDDPTSRLVFDENAATGAVITGRRTGDFAGYWDGDHHDGVPIFVPTHEAPDENPFPLVHYVTEGIEACVEQAKAAAGDRDVMMHGAYTAQEALKAGVLDVIELQLRPVLLGQGRRLFDGLPPEHIELELVRTLEAPGTLHLRYEVRRS